MDTLLVVQKYLKEVLAPNVEAQYSKETPFLAMLPKNAGVEKDVNGRFYIVVRKYRSGGVAAVGEGENLPSGSLTPEKLSLSPKWIFAGFQVTDQVLEAMKGNIRAIANYMVEAEESVRDAIAKLENRAFLQNGDGTVGKAASDGTNSTTLTLAVSSPNGDISEPALHYLAPGMTIKIGTGSPVQVVDITDGVTVTLAAQRTWAANDPVKIVGPDGSVGVEPDGLFSLIATTNNTVQGIDRTTNAWFVPHVYSTATTYNTDRQLEMRIEEMLLRAAPYGNFKNFAIFVNRSAYKRLAKDIMSIQRVVNEVELTGGFSALNFAVRGKNIPVIYDWDVPDGVVYGVNFDALTLAELAPLQWLQFDSQGNILRLSGKAVYEGYLKHYVNLGLRNAKSHFAITNGIFTV